MTSTFEQPAPTRLLPAVDASQLDLRATRATAEVLQAELKARISGEVRFDRTSRMLYSTDASNYQIEPIGVVVPRTLDDAQAALELSASHDVPILPRGGGSSLAGQTVGAALVIDFSKYLSRVVELDVENKTVTVEPGINLENLNNSLKPNGLMYGPDPASANRATVGGVIGNNSTGSHSILYGMTSDNVIAVRAALADGGVFELGPATADRLLSLAEIDDPRGRLLSKLLAFRDRHADLIKRDFPPHWRRASGYGLDELLKDPGELNPARLLVSSEGTLGMVLQATLKLVPTPARTGLVLLQFDDLVASMEATTSILEANPSAIELMDRMLINLTRMQPGYASHISFIEGDAAALLCVEFYGENEAEVERHCKDLETLLVKRKVKLMAPAVRVLDPARQASIWSVRKAGLGLLYSIRGDLKPIPVIEDVSVPVEHLAEYVGAVEKMVGSFGTTAAYYAHASAGCLHIRPLVDLHTIDGIETMKQMALASAELARRFGGIPSGEHGDGLQRSELNPLVFGPDLYDAMREFKTIWDPRGVMNPGKKVNAPSMTQHLRYGPAYQPLELKTHLDFSREGGFLQAVEMCNGAAVCRKLKAGTMCPSYMATKDEQDTTRGRANALRNALAGRTFSPDEFTSESMYEVMDLCLSCKACKTECPSSVDMAKLKTEFLAHYYERHGVPKRARIFGHIHTVSRLSSPLSPLVNLSFRTPLGKPLMRSMGVHPDRKLSPFVFRTFSRMAKRALPAMQPAASRGNVVYFHDTFTNYNFPGTGIATLKLLTAAGFSVVLEERRACCGRPMLSKGLVDDARRVARKNVALLAPYAHAGVPIIGSEPSCILTLREEYLDLLPGDSNADVVASQTFLLDEFLAKLDAEGNLGIEWRTEPGPDVFFHGHCHQKAAIGVGASMSLLKSSGCTAAESGAGCCGMAGSFGFEAEHYEISRKIGEERLFPAVYAAAEETVIAVAGVSCRQQIEHFTGRKTQHFAEVLAERLTN